MFDSFKGLKKFKQVLTLRQWPWAMLQFSTSVEVRVLVFSWLVFWLVCWSPIFLENCPKDFLAFWHEVKSS